MGEGQVLQLLGPSSGGIRRHVGYLADQLEASGWTVAVAGPAGVMGRDGRQDFDVPVPPLTALHRLPRARRRLAALAREFDLVHAHGLKAGWLASTIPGRRVVLTVHNLVLDEVAGRTAPILRALEEQLPGRVAATIGVSAEIASRFAPRDIHVVPAAAPVAAATRPAADVRAAHGIEPGAPLVVTVARLHPQKGLDVLVRAAARVREVVPGVRFLVGGSGPSEADLRAQIGRAGLDDVVTLAGYFEQPADEMAAADVVALASRWEGSPITHVEAMQCGAPLVATDVGDVADFVIDGVTGWLVPVDDDEALAAALVDAIARPDERARRASAGRDRAFAQADPQARVRAVEHVYRRVLEAGV